MEETNELNVKEIFECHVDENYQSNKNEKKDRLLQLILTGNSKRYLGKEYTEEKLNKMTEDDINKLNNIYETRLSQQMVKSLGRSVIGLYSKIACTFLKIGNSEVLSENIEGDPFLNSALQRLSCDLYYRYGAYIAPLSVGLITTKHYYDEWSNNREDDDEEKLTQIYG